ncbi:TetR/AcrR family transcriptional regulator [Nocardiopsis aegyptia]|uniref:AcrR family transcriptional regulator n=1 Tax=Nocardiopsis aegyptia TaxID=220378 RepID=A0A7Z0J8V7_9ACTN|nr:TetR/AcrR family transcriptional regulator [Nocardiopsis aegyptia]NYJ33122.1 AcrR family transcriptional regulator [Nocardiopsis aegyptia]
MRPSSVHKREAALEAAERQFLATGYESVTMDSIATGSGVAKQTLYSHFGSKRALFLELVASKTAAASDQVLAEPPPIDRRTDPRAVLREVLVSQLGTVLTPALIGLRRLVIGEATRSPELAAALYEHGPRTAVTALAAILRRCSDLALLRVADAERAATHLNWLVMGEPVNRAMLLGDDAAYMDDAEIGRHVDDALDTFLPSVTPPGDPLS